MPASRVVTRAVNDVLALAPRHGEVSLTRLVEAVSDSRGRTIDIAHADLPPGVGGGRLQVSSEEHSGRRGDVDLPQRDVGDELDRVYLPQSVGTAPAGGRPRSPGGAPSSGPRSRAGSKRRAHQVLRAF